MRNSQSNNNFANNGDVNQNFDNSKTIIKGNHIQIAIAIAVLFGIILICLVGLSTNSPERKIIGTWQINEEPQIFVTFGKNGIFSMSGDGDYLDGNYIFINKNTVQAHINYLWADFTLSGNISIIGNTMTISNMSDPDDIFGADGAKITLTKTR